MCDRMLELRQKFPKRTRDAFGWPGLSGSLSIPLQCLVVILASVSDELAGLSFCRSLVDELINGSPLSGFEALGPHVLVRALLLSREELFELIFPARVC